MKQIKLWVAVATALSGVYALADDVIRIGHAAPLSGPSARVGKDTEDGARLAIEDANARGVVIGGKKVKFELVGEDDQADPRQGVLVAQRLIDRGVKGVIGHQSSGTSIPASKIYNQAGIPQISPSATNVKLTHQGYGGVFRMVANDNQQGAALAQYAVKVLKAKTVVVIDDRTAYGQGLADVVERDAAKMGATVLMHEFGTDKTTDWQAILTSVKKAHPDAIIYGGMDATAAPLIKQARQLGVQAKFLFGDGACSSDMLQLAAGSLSADTFCTIAGLPTEDQPKGKDFMKRFKARYGVEVNLNAPFAYDAAATMIQAMEKAGSADPAKYLPVLKHIHVDGVTGPIEFDDNGDLKQGAVSVYGFKNNDWVKAEVMR